MNKSIQILFLIAFVCCAGCSSDKTPKTIAQNFIKKVYQLDFESAESLVTHDTKDNFAYVQKELQEAGILDEETLARKSQNKDSVWEFLDLKSLSEKTNPDGVDFSNSKFTVNLEKENGQWKIVATGRLLEDIIAAGAKKFIYYRNFRDIETGFQRRRDIINELMSIFKTSDDLNSKTTELKELLTKYPTNLPRIMTRTDINNYIGYQDNLRSSLQTTLGNIENHPALKFLEQYPDYIMQLEGIENRLVVLKKDFNSFAEKNKLDFFIKTD